MLLNWRSVVDLRPIKDDTGGQAVRSIDTASDAVGGLARGYCWWIDVQTKEVERIEKDDEIRNNVQLIMQVVVLVKNLDKKELAKS